MASDYAEQDVTCQNCHMPPSGEAYFALEEQGGLSHPPELIPSHFQLGITDSDFMQSTLTMDTIRRVENDQLSLQVILTNATAGHHVPTDHPGRHLILVVRVLEKDGTPLPLLDGPVIPDWGGDLSGEPGKVYAKVLMNARTGVYPVVDYWNPTLIQSDNRIPANESHETNYSFQLTGQSVTVQIQVVFRRLFQPIAETYEWDLGEIIMAEENYPVQP